MTFLTKNDYEITVIICTYNPRFKQLIATLKSVVLQKNIHLEVIVADDGSQIDYFSDIKKVMKDFQFDDFQLVKNAINRGTVSNVYSALLKARGEYIFITSPGDMLFERNSLKKFYDYAKANKAEICFCDAAYYEYNGIFKSVCPDKNRPQKLRPFEKNASLTRQKICCLWGMGILGATYLRTRKNAFTYFSLIEGECKYVEDGTSLAFALADQVRIYHFHKICIWYEYGTGISSANDPRWDELIAVDYSKAYTKVGIYNKKRYNDPIIDARSRLIQCKSKASKLLYMIFNHPIVLCWLLLGLCEKDYKPILINNNWGEELLSK